MPVTTVALTLRRIPDGTPDGELLARFVRERDGDAFGLLARRHGGMVRGVCHRVLRNDADTDDAVQATFLVFVRKAATIRDGGGLSNWLFGVARNVALKARRTRTRRQGKEAAAVPRAQATEFDLAELLHAELAKLSAAYRGAVVLCDLEGETLAAAARQLGCPVGTVASRLARGRQMLAGRMTKLGHGVPAGVLAALLADSAKATVEFTPPAFDADIPESVHTLATEVIRAMHTKPILARAAAALTACTAATALFASGQAPPKPDAAPAKAAPAAVAPKKDPFVPTKFAAFFALSQAIVKWDGDDTLSVRIQQPNGRNLKLTDAKGNAAHVSELRFAELGPAKFPVKELKLHDMAGRDKPLAEWKKLIPDGTLMLYAVKEIHDPAAFATEFGGVLREDLLVLVVPGALNDTIDRTRIHPPVESLPQNFPGVPLPGSPIQPPKKP